MHELKGLMAAATTPRKVKGEMYKEFRCRLASFTPANYFAMPLQISPFICAVSGWRMKDNSSLLVCTKCEKLLAIKVPHHLSADDKQKLCKTYQGHLWETHADHCPFRVEAKHFLQPQEDPHFCHKQKGWMIQILPLSVSRLLPQGSPTLVLLERPLRSTFRNRVIDLAAVVQDYSIEKAQLPTDVAFYRADDSSATTEGLEENSESSGTSLISRIASSCNIEKTPSNEAAISLVLLGWDIQDSNHGTVCPICCAQRSFEDSDETHTSAKRSQWNHVVESHRYFCPWVSGLPQAQDSSPLWKILVDRILDDDTEILVNCEGNIENESTTVDASTQYHELHKLLDAGVSRKRLKRSKSWNQFNYPGSKWNY